MNNRQNETGEAAEKMVQLKLESFGLKAVPTPKSYDGGIDFNVFHPSNNSNILKIQVKGRGKIQTNKKYRWFNLRSNSSAIAEAIRLYGSPNKSWIISVEKSDFYILVSLLYNEMWVFSKNQIIEIINYNIAHSSHRKENKDGRQAEMNLAVTNNEGIFLTEKYEYCRDNFTPILSVLC